MISHHISISFQSIEIAGWCGVGEKEASLTAPLVHVQYQLRGWCDQYQYINMFNVISMIITINMFNMINEINMICARSSAKKIINIHCPSQQ